MRLRAYLPGLDHIGVIAAKDLDSAREANADLIRLAIVNTGEKRAEPASGAREVRSAQLTDIRFGIPRVLRHEKTRG